MPKTNVTVELTTCDGNAFAIMGRVGREMRRIDRLRAENAQLKRALEVLAQKIGDGMDCECCTLRFDGICKNGCANRLRDWAMDKAKTETLETHIADNKGDD